MSDNKWWFLIFMIFLVVIGFKIVAWLLTIGLLVWLLKWAVEMDSKCKLPECERCKSETLSSDTDKD